MASRRPNSHRPKQPPKPPSLPPSPPSLPPEPPSLRDRLRSRLTTARDFVSQNRLVQFLGSLRPSRGPEADSGGPKGLLRPSRAPTADPGGSKGSLRPSRAPAADPGGSRGSLLLGRVHVADPGGSKGSSLPSVSTEQQPSHLRSFVNMLRLERWRGSTPKVYRVLMLGLDNAGKTQLLTRMFGSSAFGSTTVTEGYRIRVVPGENGAQLNVWDIGGWDKIRQYWSQYLDKTDLLIYVIDAADRKRFPEAGFELSRLTREKRLAPTPLLVLCNKSDLPWAARHEELSEALALDALLDRRPHRVVACSALTRAGCQEGVDWMWTRCTGSSRSLKHAKAATTSSAMSS